MESTQGHNDDSRSSRSALTGLVVAVDGTSLAVYGEASLGVTSIGLVWRCFTVPYGSASRTCEIMEQLFKKKRDPVECHRVVLEYQHGPLDCMNCALFHQNTLSFRDCT